MKKLILSLVLIFTVVAFSYASKREYIRCELEKSKYATCNPVKIVNSANRPIKVVLNITNGGEWVKVTVTVGTGKYNTEYVTNGFIKDYQLISAEFED